MGLASECLPGSKRDPDGTCTALAGGWRRGLVLGAVAAGLVLELAACASVVAQTPPTPSVTSSLSVFMSEGALSAADGSSRWTADLGVTPPASADGVLYAQGVSPDRRSELVRAVRAQDGKVLWQYLTTDSSLETVTLAGDRLLVASAKGNGGLTEALTLAALRTSDGGVLWQSAPMTVRRAPELDTPAPVVSSLAVAGGRIVAMVADGQGRSFVVAWSLADGSLAWRVALVAPGEADNYAGPFGTANVTGATVTLVYGRYDANNVLAVNPTTGKRLWSLPGFGELDLAAPTVVVLSNGITGTIIGLRPQDGTTLWRRDLGRTQDSVLNLMPATKSDSALFYTRYDQCQPSSASTIGKVCQLHLYAVGNADGSVLWQRSVGRVVNPDFAFKLLYGNDTLYYNSFYYDSAGTHHVLMALQGDGGATRWTHESYGLFAQALATDGTIFAMATACTPGQLTCTMLVEALRDADGSLAWKRTFVLYSGTLRLAEWIEVG